MDVRGMAFLARQEAIISTFGPERWRDFIHGIAKKYPIFLEPIYPVTKIPVASFLAFIDGILQDFYCNDQRTLLMMGENSAKWAYQEGPLMPYLAGKNLRAFVEIITPMIWRQYFSFGEVQGTLNGKVANIVIQNLPIEHIYFELASVGFVLEGFRQMGAKPFAKKIVGIDSKQKKVHYEYTLG